MGLDMLINLKYVFLLSNEFDWLFTVLLIFNCIFFEYKVSKKKLHIASIVNPFDVVKNHQRQSVFISDWPN